MTSTDTAAGRMRLRLGEGQRSVLRRWAGAGYPNEACGVLIGTGDAAERTVAEVRRARNLEPRRSTDFYVLDPEAFLAADREAREDGLDIVGFWHSHPDSPAVPSETDRARAWPGYVYVIVSVRSGRAGEIRAWTLENESFQEGMVIA